MAPHESRIEPTTRGSIWSTTLSKPPPGFGRTSARPSSIAAANATPRCARGVLRLLSACGRMGDFLSEPPLRAPEILQDSIGDKDLRLNYWNWGSSHNRGIPELYRSDTLDYADRYFGGLTKTDVDTIGLLARRELPPFLMSANSGPHGSVQLAFKKGGCTGPMVQVEFAALDSVFFAHHANRDRRWCSRMAANGNPPYQPSEDVPDHRDCSSVA
jgi:hypothetical protein